MLKRLKIFIGELGMSRFVDHTGKVFGRWTVRNFAGKNQLGKTFWICDCVCGNSKKVSSSHLVSGKSKSCGCFRKDRNSKENSKHHKSESTEYSIWRNIKTRCCNKNNERYPDYGGRGVKICDRWLDSFENFYEDMGDRPSDIHTIERLNVNGGYSPDNCVWATNVEQSRNRRRRVDNSTGFTGVNLRGGKDYVAIWVTLEGKTKSKSFSINKYGKEEAFRLACEARENAIKELNEQGAGYSGNHGK